MSRYRRPPSRLPALALALALLAAAGGALWLYLGRQAGEPLTLELPVPPEPPKEAKPVPPARPAPPARQAGIRLEPPPEPAPKPAPKQAAARKPRLVLPLLDDSDPMVRDGFVSFTRHEGANAWLSPSDLARRFVVIVHSLSLGQVARDSASILAPLEPFMARQTGEDSYEMDAASYARYNLLADIVASIDAGRAADFYRLLQPLLQEAYQELGYGPGESFNDAVFRALDRMLDTPVLERPIPLVRPKVRYEFADPALESRSALQKQLLRMGPRNIRLLQRKARELSLELQRALRG